MDEFGNFVKRPLYHILKFFGLALRHNPDYLSSQNAGKVRTLVLKWQEGVNRRVRLFFLNKASITKNLEVNFDAAVPTTATVWRYSQTETTVSLKSGADATAIVPSISSTQILVNLSKESITIIDLYGP